MGYEGLALTLLAISLERMHTGAMLCGSPVMEVLESRF